MSHAGSTAKDVDYEALRAKYIAERDRRLRPDGEDQYVEVNGKYSTFADEPDAVGTAKRAPVTREVDTVIVGGGWSGEFAGARLTEAGQDNFLIIEDGADFGGTWYWNQYPGAQCDIESYCYLPLLEETGYMPKEKYSYAPEIFEHARRIGQHYKLYERALFKTRVTDMHWDDGKKCWIVNTNCGDDIRSRFVILASGPASRPKLPGVPGFDDFEGRVFHTSRWDYDYTGGDHSGNLVKLQDKNIAVIGTGASAIQCVPHLAKWAKHLYVFQRTPSSVDVRGNKPTDPEWARSLKPGWQTERRNNFNAVVTGQPFEVDLVADSWTDIFRRLATDPFAKGETHTDGEADAAAAELRAELADFDKMEEIRQRCEREVGDPDTAERLKPYYRQFCKRPTFNDDYLPAFNRPNVTLVDTSGSYGVERITKDAVVANGQEYPVDCIILATGFEMSTSYKRRIGIEIYGRNGESLYEHWAKGMRTLHGHSIHGFPNWFFVGLSQIGASFNYALIVDEMARQVAYIIAEVQKRGVAVIEATSEGEQAWVDEIRANAGSINFLKSCTPGYFNNEGKVGEVIAGFQDFYGPGAGVFNQILADWRSAGTLEGMVATPATP